VIETERVDMVDGHEKMTHEKDSTRAMVTKKIPANCGDIRCSRTLFGLSCGGFLEYSVFLPFITRGKRFYDTISTKVVCRRLICLLDFTTLTEHKQHFQLHLW